MRTLLLILFPVLLSAQAQTNSFGLRSDSTGVYFIRQTVTTWGERDSVDTHAIATRFQTAQEAEAAVRQWRTAVERDSATLQRIYQENVRHRAELDGVLAQLALLLNPKSETPAETPEQELARLRTENERLKKSKN